MNINIYMFNDHILFSNNLNDAANQLRNIQVQKLEEEKYKQRSIKLQEQINELQTIIHDIESGKILNEAWYDIFLGRLGRAAGEEAEIAGAVRNLKKTWSQLHPDEWARFLEELKGLGFVGNYTKWIHPTKGETFWVIRNEGGMFIPYRWNGTTWIGVNNARTPWGRSGGLGYVTPPKGMDPNNTIPLPNGGWGQNPGTAATAQAPIDNTNPFADDGDRTV